MIILFDLDGTLIDSTEAILESFHNSFDIYECEHPSDEEIKALIGYPLEVMYSNLGVTDERIDAFVKTYKEYYRVISCERTELLENAKEAVLRASKIAELGIVTTKTGKYSKVIMEHFELMEYFEVLIGREHVENPKPNAEPILTALESFDTKGKEIWMIGDTKLDLISAKNAEVNAIGVLCGYGNKNDLEKHTKIVVDNALEAIMFLEISNRTNR